MIKMKMISKYQILLISVLKTPEDGAQTIIYCSVEPSVSHETGLYYAECAEKTPSPLAHSQREAGHLWRVSQEIVDH